MTATAMQSIDRRRVPRTRAEIKRLIADYRGQLQHPRPLMTREEQAIIQAALERAITDLKGDNNGTDAP